MAGSLLYIQGPKRYLNFEDEYLGGWSRKINAQEQKEVVWYNPGKFYLYGENLTVLVQLYAPSISEGDRVCLHILNESLSTLWKEKEIRQDSVVSQNLSNNACIR